MSNSPVAPLSNLFDLNKIQTGLGKFQQNVLKNIPTNLKQNGEDFIKNVTNIGGNILGNLNGNTNNSSPDSQISNPDLTAADNTKKILSAVENMNGNSSDKLVVVKKKSGQSQTTPSASSNNNENENENDEENEIENSPFVTKPSKKNKKGKNGAEAKTNKKRKTFFVDDGTEVREEDESFAEFTKNPEKKKESLGGGIISWFFNPAAANASENDNNSNSENSSNPDADDVESLIESNNKPIIDDDTKKAPNILSFIPFFKNAPKKSASADEDEESQNAPKSQINSFFNKMKQAVGLAPKQPDRPLWFYERWLKSFDDWISAKLHLTIVQRVVGFGLCAVLGAASLFLATYFLPTIFLTLSACLFGLLYAMANIFFWLSTCFVAGPVNQVKSMCSPVRIIPSSLYLTSLFLILISALYLHSGILVFILVFVQLFSLGWYLFTYIPFANSFAGRMLTSVVLGRI